MQSIYTSYKCTGCRKEFVLLTEDIEQMKQGRYIACPYCNSKHVAKEKATDSLKECMKHDSYIRVRGALRSR